MSSDLHTGRTPASKEKGVALPMAGNIVLNVPKLSPDEYRKRKVALLTGACAFHTQC